MSLGDFSDLMHALVVLPLLAFSFASGLLVQRRLSERHRGPKTHEMLRVVMEMLVTFAAIVLGLLITTSKTGFDAVETEVRSFAIEIITLDQTLASYGPQTAPLRAALVHYTQEVLTETANAAETPATPLHSGLLRRVDSGILSLIPTTAMQSHLQQVAVQQLGNLQRERHQIDDEAQEQANLVFYAVLSVWLMVVYGCFGLISEHTWLGSTVVGLSMLAIVLALFVTFEMDSPFSGLIVVSNQPIVDALRTVAAE